MKISNKDIIQSYILTTAKYDFSVYEKRILYRIIELQQMFLKGKKLSNNYSLSKNLFNDTLIEMPVSAFLTDEKDKNHARVKKALVDLENKKLEYETEGEWKLIRLIERPHYDKYESIVKFRLAPEINQALMNFSKGFRKYELKVAMEFESIYSMRFYELFSGLEDTHITYSVSKIKAMFKLENKYSRINDFIKNVIQQAKKELDKKAPYSFNFKQIKKGRKISSIQFYIYKIEENRDVDLEEKRIALSVSNRWVLKNETINYLQNILLFSDKQISNNLKMIEQCEKTFDIITFLSSIKKSILNAENQQGYALACLKNKIKSEQEQMKINSVITDISKKFSAR